MAYTDTRYAKIQKVKDTFEKRMMSPHDGGTHLECRRGRSGVKALSQILSDESLSYSLKHIYTGEHSLHISWSTHIKTHLYGGALTSHFMEHSVIG